VNFRKFQEQFIPTTLFLVTLGVVPWLALEPINSVKFLFLTVAGVMSFGLIVQNYSVLLRAPGRKRTLLAVIVTLISTNIFVFFFSNEGWRQQLFGNLGRNTGLIFYLSLAFILIFVLYFSDDKFESAALKIFNICGMTSIAYSFIQYFGIDPIGWKNPYSSLIGFQGNPNFQSSFLGLYSIFLLSNLIFGSESKLKKMFTTVTLVLSMYIIVMSDSIQGVFVFFTGASLLFLYLIKFSKARIIFLPYLISLIVGFALTVFGLLQKGPLQFLYQPSVSFRGDYWRAGWNMFQDNLIFGLGHSSFGNYYMSYRDSKSLSGIGGRGVDTFSNSAHNVFVDIAVSGGLMLLVPYSALILFSIYFLFKVTQDRLPKNDKIALFSALWFAYLLQSIISVQFATLAFWGWVFLGLFFRNAIDSMLPSFTTDGVKSKSIKGTLPLKSSKNNSVAMLLSAFVGIGIGILPLWAGIAQKSAYESQRLDRVISSAYVEILDADRMNQIGLLLAKNNQIPEALEILNKAKEVNPRNYDTWLLISKLSPPESTQSKEAYERYIEINPYAKIKDVQTK
jgi:O-antigen ligase